MKLLVNICRILVGGLFVFSGSVKAIDPLGTAYKMHDYFAAMNLGFLDGLTVELAVFMIVFEIVLGVALLVGFMPKLTTWLLLLTILFFTFLTGYTYLHGFINPEHGKEPEYTMEDVNTALGQLDEREEQVYNMEEQAYAAYEDEDTTNEAWADSMLIAVDEQWNNIQTEREEWMAAKEELENPVKQPLFQAFDERNMKVTDCGCFGDFLKLHPRTSFFKDIILTIMILILLFGAKHIKPLYSKKGMAGTVAGFTVVSLVFCFSNYVWSLPIADFRPYKVGNHIPDQMIGVPDVVDYVFVYKNKETGEEQEFTMDALPDSEGWEFVSRDETIIEKGKPAPIANWSVERREDAMNMDSVILQDPNYSLMVIAYDLPKTKAKVFTEKINPLFEAAEANGLNAFVITAAGDEYVEEFRHEYQTPYPFYSADATFLKTIIRSNPGLVLLKNGTVMGKWHHTKIPTFEKLQTKQLN